MIITGGRGDGEDIEERGANCSRNWKIVSGLPLHTLEACILTGWSVLGPLIGRPGAQEKQYGLQPRR
eukprot:scaffold874_cov126-Cylindrotheca_fusiformis.AAC.9